jgi:tRNA modification GTPase
MLIGETMPQPLPLQVVQLTPPGRGAVATLRIEGPHAVETVQASFRARSGRPLAAYSTGQLVVGRFGGEQGEEVVARHTGDEAVELHCHGGRAAVAMIEETLVAAGCRRVGWQDWTVVRYDDSIAAAARVALADARSERCAAILLDQHEGALGRALDEIRQAIGRGDASSARAEIDALLAQTELGRHLTRPWSVVLAGRANVGKSSLLNALVGHGRAIVHHAPGTTRDAVTVTTAIDGWPVELCDTAGLRPPSDAVERAGIELARERLARADLVVLVADQNAPWSADDQALFDQWPAATLVHNKCDLPASAGERPTGLRTSALGGEGIEVLLETIARRLVPAPPPPGAAVPFTDEQVETINRLTGELARRAGVNGLQGDAAGKPAG